jgi:PAS domain-containing protein
MRTLREVCEKLAQMTDRHQLLGYILRLAAHTASSIHDEKLEARLRDRLRNNPVRFGVWDWDVSNDKSYCDSVIAEMFSVDAKLAAAGLPIADYIGAIHPDDLTAFSQAISRSTTTGGLFEARYRLLTKNRITWVLARGHCFLDDSGRPFRFPGAVVDVSEDLRLIG